MTNPFTLPTLSKEKHDYMGLFDFEKWYPAISQFTFATQFVPLTREEAEAMVLHYQVYEMKHAKLFTPSHQKIISDAIAKLDQLMSDNKSYFVRISTRSPKDAALFSGEQFNEAVKEEIVNIKKQHGENTNDKNKNNFNANVKQIAVYQMSINAMKVTNGHQAMDLLLQSERIFTDLRPSLTHDENWDLKFIIREFVPLDISYEFRGFACNKTLTALTQYNHTCFFPHLQNHEQEIVDKIVEFYEQFKDNITYQAYVIDFAIIGEDVKVIEINPFGVMTGGSLFSWPHDRKVLQGNMDIYSDNFGIKENDNENKNKMDDNSNNENNNNENEKQNENNNNKEEEESIILETQSTKSYNNNVKTILRTIKWIPSFITDEYVDSLFYGVFHNNNEKQEDEQPQVHEEEQKQKCIIS